MVLRCRSWILFQTNSISCFSWLNSRKAEDWVAFSGYVGCGSCSCKTNSMPADVFLFFFTIVGWHSTKSIKLFTLSSSTVFYSSELTKKPSILEMICSPSLCGLKTLSSLVENTSQGTVATYALFSSTSNARLRLPSCLISKSEEWRRWLSSVSYT